MTFMQYLRAQFATIEKNFAGLTQRSEQADERIAKLESSVASLTLAAGTGGLQPPADATTPPVAPEPTEATTDDSAR